MDEKRAGGLGAAFRRGLWSSAVVLLVALLPSVALGNAVSDENALTGNPASEWDISGAGDPDIQGFATDISVNRGGTIHFKISSSSNFGIRIYRLGYYQGNGARLVADLGSSFTGLVQSVPTADPVTGLVDCGTWTESASWAVPAPAVSGIYVAKLTRAGGGSSHIVFVVRDDASTSDLVFKTSDATWQAYNVFGGNSLYVGSVAGFPAGHAPKVSYNRPFLTRSGGGGGGAAEDWLFNAEYPMVRFLEANGYDVTYTTDVDADRYGSLLLNHGAFLSVGHDEYWSGGERAAVEAARDAGVHLAFLSGNEVYWKTRWESSTDGSSTPYRTLVCYKEGTLGEYACGGKCDPLADTWTGLWRDGCAYPAADGCRPENALTGQISWDGTTGTLRVPDTYKSLRFWRNTPVAALGAGQTLDLTPGTLGYEWDWEQYAEHYAAGRVRLSTTVQNGRTHHLSLHRAPSGALVFGAGTVQWAWGLDSNHDRGSDAPSPAMRQATVNLLAEMGAQPASLQVGLVAATATGDLAAPVSTIGFPAAGASLQAGTPVVITGTAADAAGVVVGVEVSVDGGATWQAATGTTSWAFNWTPAATGAVTLKSRAFDDLGNLEAAGAGPAPNVVAVTVTPGSPTPPPSVTSTTPGNNATGVASNAALTATFGADLDPATVTTSTFELRDAGNTLVAAAVDYDVPSRTATLTPGTLLATSAVYTARLAGGATDPRIKDLAGTALAADYSWSFTTAAPDLAPPVVTSTTPAAAAGGVAPNATVNAVFDEALSPSSVNTLTFELRDASNALVPGTVTYDLYARTATLTPSAALVAGGYTARLAGGAIDPRIKDLAGNALAADHTWSFTVLDYNCPCTVWSPSTLPGTADFPDARALELGFKFRAALDGWVTGVRFYKGVGNTGTHVGSLWTSAGVLLSSATFTGETATGWQEVTFGAPVAITAATTYVASYHTNTGHYAEDVGYFQSAVDNPPLRALTNGEDGPNGLYALSATSTFPGSTYESSNYWVDVVFVTSVGPDETPPVVVSHVPASGAPAVAAGASVTATFNEPVDPATVDGATFELRDAANALVAATVSYSAAARTATLVPAGALAYSTLYTATIRGGATDPRIKDVAGNPLAADVTWSFTTAAEPPPPPTEGPGGPILVVSAATNPFSRYFVEILRAEGLNAFTAMDLSLVTPAVLAAHDVVILGEIPLDAAQVTMLTDWTTAGGTLVAMRPDADLAGLLGITPVGDTLSNDYLLVNTASGPGAGIVGQTIQFHGKADLYTLSGASSIATLYSDATTPTAYPAVTTRNVGTNGGKAVAFTYDLARSVVYTRQGNPAWKNQKRDGAIPPIRSDDLFYGNASFDPQPDWVDLNKVAIPQADEQQRLLANIVTLGNLHRMPLPRFWYLPKGLKAAIVMTGDNHGDGGMQPRFDIYRTQSPADCSVEDWECVRATGYEYVGSTFTNAQAIFYNSLGFEVALHIDTGCASVPEAQYEQATINQLANFGAVLPGIPLPQTNRSHCIAWTDWTVPAEVSARHGIRYDTNYYYWPYAWFQGRSGMFTGSGIPMRFAKEDGSIVDCYQGATQMTDDALSSFTTFCNELLDRAQGPEGYYGVFNCNLHFDNTNHAGSNQIVASAQAHGVPVVSAKQMLDWVDGRNNSSFAGLTWSGNTLGFSVAAAAGSRNMRAMVPTLAAVGQLTGITRGGTPIAYTTETIKGIEYAFFPAEAGAYLATYLEDETAPLITNVVATPHDDGTATVTWTTTEPSDSRVDYGVAQDPLDLNAVNAALVTSHVVTLTGLAPSTTYYFRVTSADAASNAATEPPTASSPLGFSTPAPVCFVDDTALQFAAGTPDAGIVVTSAGNGELSLKPAAGADFAVIPPTTEWQAFPFAGGGSATVSGGQLVVDGARFNTEPVGTTWGPGSSVEFVATFQASAHQYVGFGGGTDAIASGGLFYGPPWAMFGTGTAGAEVLARVYAVAGSPIDFGLGSSLLGTPHKYRVDWKASSVDFYVDDALVHTEVIALPAGMRVGISDLAVAGSALSVDWVRVSPPYAANGSFVSRVYDGAMPTTWGEMTWTAAVPAGTSVQMHARQGDTPAPDGTWTAFAPVATSGAVVGGTSRYLQYRADLATTDPNATPQVATVHVSCASGPDGTPPAISNVTATSGAAGTSALIAWNTDELATSRVDYGAAPEALSLNVSSGALVGIHGLTLPGLTVNTPYYYRVTSTDGSSNTAVEPPLASPPLEFTTTGTPCAQDVTAADFSAGTTGAGTWVSETTDGEVILAPAAAGEFSGTTLPAGWMSAVYGGSLPVVGGGHISLDGAYAATTGDYAAGHSVEFVATFDAAAPGQHAGFGTDLNGAPWAIFSTGTGGALAARTNDGTELNEPIAGAWLGAPHRFRVEWAAGEVRYWIDGALVATHVRSIGTNMRPIVSDGPVGGNPLQVDWMRMTPYAASGSYTSRVFDAGGPATWGLATWSGSVPAGTSLAMLARTGNTPAPDGTWSTFTAVPAPGANLAASGRYLQYRADLATTDPVTTPALLDVAIACSVTNDPTPPVISGVSAAPGLDGVSATVTWTTDEPADSRVDYGTSSGSLTSSATDAAFVSSHTLALSGLAPGTTYHYRVTSADVSANSATSPVAPATLTFATPAVPCPADVTAADFGLGTLDANTVVSLEGNGELILKPAGILTEFSGTSLPVDWSSANYPTGGTTSVAGGAITVDGSRAFTNASFGPGLSLEFVATFTTSTFQNVGLAGDGAFGNPWIVIGQGTATDGVYARTSVGSAVLLSSGTLGTPHRYRIDWRATTNDFLFYVDGVLVPTPAVTQTVATNMVVLVSDYNGGGNTLSVDWLRVTPYAASGSFASRVFDGGGPTTWGAMTWTGSTPAGTGLSMSARTGNTAVPDGGWTAFESRTNGQAVGGNSRYVQYRADLTSAAPGYATPVLRDVAIACISGPDLAPPTITNVVATPATNGLSATITWTTDEAANSRVDYGTNPGSLGSSATDAISTVSHSVNLTGLSPGLTYHFRVRSADPSANEATEPNPPADPLSFTTPLQPCLSDVAATDFGAGSHTGTVVTLEADGEVTLAPAVGEEFSGTSLPADWTSVPWVTGTSTVSGGAVSVDGSRLTSPIAVGYSAGHVLEFVATFGAALYQNAGWGAGDNSTGAGGMYATGDRPWAMFGTAGTSTTMHARLNPGGDVAIPGSFIGTPHRYRVEWRADNTVVFSIDGVVRDTRTGSFSGYTMRPGITDYADLGPVLRVDWLRVTPYAASGTFASRVYDAGTASSWGAMTWSADVPAGTALAMSARRGDTPAPDGSWSAWAPVATSGATVGGVSRYLQYGAALTANAGLDLTPVLRDVGVTCGACNASAPPVIADLAASATGNAGGGRAHVRLNWGGTTAGDAVAVYRKAYGDYPLYRDGPGAAPPAPADPAAAVAAGWTLTGVTSSGGLDSPPARGFWYYVAFVSNACAVVSGPSNRTAGTLDYLLGDVSDGSAVCLAGGEAGDGVVNTPDLSALGDRYGQSFPQTDDRICLDVGPTVNYGLRSRPAPDGVLDFEDLVLYALNYGVPLPAAARPVAGGAQGQDEVSLAAPSSVTAGQSFDAVVRLDGSGTIHALSAKLAWDRSVAAITGFDAGPLLAASGGIALSSAPGTIDAAVLGAEQGGFAGAGDLVVVHFRALASGAPLVRLDGVRARDAANQPVTPGAAGGTPPSPVSVATGFGPVFPNPFSGDLNVSFALARETRVTLTVFDLAGRVVRHLEDASRPAGSHRVSWDGRSDAGLHAPAGMYVVRLKAGEIDQTRRVQLIR